MSSALEHLLLLRDSREYELQGRTFEVVSESTGSDTVDRVAHTPPDGPEGLHAFFATDEPRVVD